MNSSGDILLALTQQWETTFLRGQCLASPIDCIMHSGIAKLNLFPFYFSSDLSFWAAVFLVPLERPQPLTLSGQWQGQHLRGCSVSPRHAVFAQVVIGELHLSAASLSSCLFNNCRLLANCEFLDAKTCLSSLFVPGRELMS